MFRPNFPPKLNTHNVSQIKKRQRQDKALARKYTKKDLASIKSNKTTRRIIIHKIDAARRPLWLLHPKNTISWAETGLYSSSRRTRGCAPVWAHQKGDVILSWSVEDKGCVCVYLEVIVGRKLNVKKKQGRGGVEGDKRNNKYGWSFHPYQVFRLYCRVAAASDDGEYDSGVHLWLGMTPTVLGDEVNVPPSSRKRNLVRGETSSIRVNSLCSEMKGFTQNTW